MHPHLISFAFSSNSPKPGGNNKTTNEERKKKEAPVVFALSSVISLPYFRFSSFILFLLFLFFIFFFYAARPNLLASLQIADSFSMQKEDVSKCHKAEG